MKTTDGMFDQLDHEDTTQLDSEVLPWLARNYESAESWKSKAREIFFRSNGDSDLARQRLASLIRAYFLDESLTPEEILKWAGIVQEKITVVPPKITATNAGHFDWLYVADYFLLCCASPSEEYEKEVQIRETDFQQLLNSYNLRMQVIAARKVLKELSSSDDASILASIKDSHPKASLANVKEARKLESKGSKLLIPREPKRPGDLQLYKALYF